MWRGQGGGVGEEDAGGEEGGDEEAAGEARFAAVEDVPECGVDEGEGEGELEGGLPGEAALGSTYMLVYLGRSILLGGRRGSGDSR